MLIKDLTVRCPNCREKFVPTYKPDDFQVRVWERFTGIRKLTAYMLMEFDRDNHELAQEMHLAYAVWKNYSSQLYIMLGLGSRPELILYMLNHPWLLQQILTEGPSLKEKWTYAKKIQLSTKKFDKTAMFNWDGAGGNCGTSRKLNDVPGPNPDISSNHHG